MVHSKQVSEKCENSHQEFSAEGSLEPAGTDTDSGLSGSLRGDASKRLVRGASEGLSEESSSPTCHSPKEDYPLALSCKMSVSPPSFIGSSDAGVAMETTHGRRIPETWKFEEEEAPPLQFKIEEHIEEITTHHITDEESNSSDIGEGEKTQSETDNRNSDGWQSGKPKYTFRKRRFATKIESDAPRNLLPAFDLPSISDESVSSCGRVPFPELGVDLLPECLSSVDGGPSELVLENSDWKENWLFRREKYRTTPKGQSVDTITMLIPNPSSNVTPTIGDRDIDELSELSDRHSNYSFDVSSDEEFNQDAPTAQLPPKPSRDLIELVGEISIEFGQQDQEYTEDTTIVDRLHLTNCSQRVRASLDSSSCLNDNVDSEVTHVAPVPKPRRVSLQNHPLPKVDRTSTFSISKLSNCTPMGKFNFSNFPSSDIILTPPKNVPQEFDNESRFSPTVWFESSSKNQVVPAGRTLRITCQVHAKQIFGLSWYYGKKLLRDGKTVLTWMKDDTYHLNVFEMSERKAGTYVVCAYTRDDCVWAKCQVLCTEQGRVNKVPRFTLVLSDTIVEAGNDVALECQVGGHPEPKVTFQRNSLPLTPSENCFIENDQYGTWNIHLLGIEQRDGGQIKAIGSNFLGHAMTSCQLSVLPEGQFVNQYSNNTDKTAISQSRKKKKSSSVSGNNKTRDFKSTSASTLSYNFEDDNELANNGFQSSFINSYSDCQRFSQRHNRNHIDVSMDTVDNGHNNQEITVNGCLFQPPKPGTIAEREHRKWLEAKPLPNNPYSPEKLASRLGQMSSRFPSLPGVCRDTSGDEYQDPYLGEGLLSSSSDLSRYSRDYHVNNTLMKREQRSVVIPKHEHEVKEISRAPPCLVKIEPQKSSADWREELKHIKLDVGKKVADIQKTIDACHHEWERRLHQKGWNPCTKRRNLKYTNQKLSSSCINLSTPPKSKAFSSSKNRHLVYSSTEALNSTKHKEQNRNDIWRTVSVDTLNPPPKFSMMSSKVTSDQRINQCPRFESRDSMDSKKGSIISDSDDSSVLYASYCNPNNAAPRQTENNNSTYQNGHANRRLTSYYSENSIESLKEESDTEESASAVGDNSNLPSVKELASKFDSAKNSRHRTPANRKTHEKLLKSSRNKDILIIDQRDQNDSVVPPYSSSGYNKRFNDKITMNEVHHSLTARSVSKSFREGLRLHTQKTQVPLETLTDESVRLPNQECQPTERDTASPEHLGIPSSPASIPTRHQYPYPPPGDTSDDSMVASLTPRKNYRKKNSGGSSSRLIKTVSNGEFKKEPYLIFD